jgi:hypothetical protein
MSDVTAIRQLTDGLDRVTLSDGAVLDVHRPSLSLAVGQRARVTVRAASEVDKLVAPYVVQAKVYDRLGDSIYASAGGLLHRLPKVNARIGDALLIAVTPLFAQRRPAKKIQ